MKIIHVIIGIMLALMLCITPVAAVSADDFKIDVEEDGKLSKYTYCNVNKPKEKYIQITTYSTRYSLITFQPANIPGAPVMVVNTGHRSSDIFLPRSVDEWEIKSYGSDKPFDQPDDKLLKNAGVVNLGKISKKYTSAKYDLVQGKYIIILNSEHRELIYTIPDVVTKAFKVDIERMKDSIDYSYKYYDIDNPDEECIEIFASGTHWLSSQVTIKPVGILDAPLMVVDTTRRSSYINLSKSVDEWEIKYYSKFDGYPSLTNTYLKNAGVVNLKEFFGVDISKGLELELSTDQKIHPMDASEPSWDIPDVN